MFELYTERARRTIFFARYEASTFGSPYIEAEFLLLGILRENKNVIVRWLGEGDWQNILQKEIEKRFDRGLRTSTSVDLPLSNEAKRVLAYAAEEAERLSHKFIGAEHLFLGLLRETGSHVAKMLSGRGVDIRTVREAYAKEGLEADRAVGRGVGSTVTQHSFQVEIFLEEGSSPLTLIWRSRVPVVGEQISVARGDGEVTTYQVVTVEWRVDSRAEQHSLSKALIHVQKLK
jgi:ATP-dependent Clp protease ATP-binding subunit ClpC